MWFEKGYRNDTFTWSWARGTAETWSPHVRTDVVSSMVTLVLNNRSKIADGKSFVRTRMTAVDSSHS